jgi:nucleotidyltransferase AbiEii toxin of type IV toxin-antitoxin system
VKRFVPKLDKLPPPQRRLWVELAAVQNIVLYGGTAVALRLGHRTSIDFDFFSNDSFQPGELLRTLPWRAEAQPIQSSPNTLSFVLDRGGPVKLSFFGGLSFGRVGQPDAAADTGLLCASLLDLGATKLKTLHDRAESKDYVDIAAILESGLQLSHLLAAARALYGDVFNSMIALKALTYFQDGDLPSLPPEAKQSLIKAAEAVRELPEIARLSDRLVG